MKRKISSLPLRKVRGRHTLYSGARYLAVWLCQRPTPTWVSNASGFRLVRLSTGEAIMKRKINSMCGTLCGGAYRGNDPRFLTASMHYSLFNFTPFKWDLGLRLVRRL